MRKRKQLHDFTETPMQAAIMDAVSNNVLWSNIQTLVEAAHAAGQIDLTVAWDDYGRSFLGAALGATRDAYKKVPERELLEAVLAIDPLALTREDTGGNTPVDHFLDLMARAGDGSTYKINETADWWFTHAPMQKLLQWVPDNHRAYEEENSVQSNGYHLISTVLKCENNREEKFTTTNLSTLAGLGVDMNARNHNEKMAAGSITQLCQWDAFIANGGDAALKPNPHSDTPRPLWEVFADQGNEKVQAAAKQWAYDNATDDIKQKQYDAYWTKLSDRARSSVSPTEISAHIRSHPDNLTLRDPKGRNPTMYAVQMHASSWKTLEQKRLAALLPLRDNDGNSLWQYAFVKGKSFGTEMLIFMLGSDAPMDPSPVSGRGWVASMLLDMEPMKYQSQNDMFPRDNALKKLLSKTKGEHWWAMAPGDEAKIHDKLMAFMDHNEMAKIINQLVCEHLDLVNDEELVTKVLTYNIKAQGRVGDINMQGVRAYFERGMAKDMDDKTLASLRHRMDDKDFGETTSLYQAQQIERDAPQVSDTRRNMRF